LYGFKLTQKNANTTNEINELSQIEQTNKISAPVMGRLFYILIKTGQCPVTTGNVIYLQN